MQRITARVDTHLEMAEITDRVSKSEGGGKALLFENNGTDYPVLMNMMGSDRRIAMALGVESLDEIAERINRLIKSVTAPKNGVMAADACLLSAPCRRSWRKRRLIYNE